MIVFDTLSYLESYTGPFPEINTIISVMDRSLPYDQLPGRYDTPEESSVKYIIDECLSSEKGFDSPKQEGRRIMEIVLEGEEMVSVSSSVFRLSEGSFLIYSGDEAVKRGIMYALPVHFKAVRFIF